MKIELNVMKGLTTKKLSQMREKYTGQIAMLKEQVKALQEQQETKIPSAPPPALTPKEKASEIYENHNSTAVDVPGGAAQADMLQGEAPRIGEKELQHSYNAYLKEARREEKRAEERYTAQKQVTPLDQDEVMVETPIVDEPADMTAQLEAGIEAKMSEADDMLGDFAPAF